MADHEGATRDAEQRGGRRRLPRRLLGALAVLVVVALAAWFLVIPYPWTLSGRNPTVTSLMEQRLREAAESGDSLHLRHTWVGLDEISPRLVRAVIVAEDYRFREHHGVDWASLAEEVHWTGDDDFSWTSTEDLAALRAAIAYAWSHRSEIRGRSSLTQQLAKNLYFGTDRSFVRKGLEFIVAGRLERRLGKDRILELYLNVAEWGPGIFGAEEAARTYFGRSASELTLDQAAALAATLPHPLTSNPSLRPGRMLWRKELILDRIDPSRRAPPEPIPLPEIEITPPDLPDLGTPPETTSPVTLDTGVVELAHDTMDIADTVSPADTTSPKDTIAPTDTIARVDTIGG